MGDITYFTESYLDILNDKPEYKAPSSVHGKEKRAAQRDRRWLWPGGRIHYKFSDYYYGENNSTYIYYTVVDTMKHVYSDHLWDIQVVSIFIESWSLYVSGP